MDVKDKSAKKVPKRAILIAVMSLFVVCIAAVTLLSIFQKETFRNQFSEDAIRAYLASNDSEENGVTPEAADLWLQEFLSSEQKGTVEINRTLKIQKGYTINGTKTITGKGTFLAENSSGGNIFSVSESSSFFVEGINADCNYGMNVGVNVKENASLSWKGGSILRAMDYGIFSSGDVKVEESSIQDCGVWMEIRSGSKANAKDTEFYKCGSGGIVVAKDAECHITGEKTLIEQSGKEAIKNEGTFTMTDGNIYMTNGYGIDNFGTATLTGVKQNRSVLGGLVLNEIGATATVKDCVLWNNIYHVRNYGEMNLEECELNTATGSSILNEPEGTVNIKSVSVVNGNNYAIYNRNGIANVKDLECELILNTGIVNIGDGIVKIDGYSIDRCQMGIENRASDEYGYGEIHANDVTIKNAGNRNIFSWGGVCNISNSTLYPSEGYSVYIRGGSAILDSVKILGTIKETSGGLAVGSTIYKDPVVTIKGNTEITGCASRGIINYNKLTIYNCDIHDNNTSGKLTSGVGIYSVGDVYMHGGKIHDNYGTKYGAGIRLDRNEKAGLIGNLYMYGGSIFDNEAGISGGGVSVAEKCLFEMRGGSIYNNRGAVRGDGMVISGTFNLYDAERIGENDIYLTEGNKINVKSDKLSFDFAKLSLASYAKTVKEVVVFPNNQIAEKYYSKFNTKNQQFAIAHSENAGILVHNTKDFDTTYDFSKAQVVTVTTFKQLKEVVESTKPDESKVILIAADIVMTDKITLPQRTGIKLTDDGTAHKLVRGTDKNLFDVGRMSYLVLGGTVGIAVDGDSLNGKVAKTSLVCVSNFGYFVLEDGATLQNAVNNGTSSNSGVRGAAVNVAMDGNFIMRGGVITNCSSQKDDKYSDKYCAVYNSSSGGVSIKGGTISNCNDRAILSLNNVFMSGGTIDNCQHALSGGGAVRTPMFVMTGGAIQNCLSTNAGSAVYLTTNTGSYARGYFKLDGGTITGNQNGTTLSISTFGGAVYIDKTSTFDFKSGKISDNVAGDKDYRMACAGILNDGVVNIGKDAVITGNVSTLSTGAIYNRASGTMTITGATITDNTSTNVRWVKDNSRYGSAAAINNEGTLILDGAKVTDNNVGTYGTVYSSNGNVTFKNMTFTGNESGANGTITDDYGNELAQNNKGVDVTIAKDTNTVTLAGKIEATETESAFRLNLDKTFKLADDFSTESKINLYLHDNIYVGRQVLKGNVTPETVACFTWTNPKMGYFIGADGRVDSHMKVAIGDTTYKTLEDAVEAAEEGDIIKLLSDVWLNQQLVIDKAITITTDGEKDRTIFGDEGALDDNVIVVNSGANVAFKGASDDSQLIFDGTGQEISGTFIRIDGQSPQTVAMQYVTMQNITGSKGWGGAIYISAAAAGSDFTNCTFAGCSSAVSYGGAIAAKGELTVTNCSFTSCSSVSGGAIYCDANLTVQKCEFGSCLASGEGGAIYAINDHKVNILDSIFTENESTANRGGAICVGTKRSNPINISGCTFVGNKAKTNGGAIRISAVNTLNITDSTFDGNTATKEFGGAVAMGTSGSILNLYGTCIFSGNESSSNKYGGGGAIFAPVNFNIKTGAWIEMTGNNCKNSIGDAICVQTNAVTSAKFIVEEGAALYVYDNTAEENNPVDDICITNGTSLAPTVNEGGSYGAWNPVAKIGNLGYETLHSAVNAVSDGGEIRLLSDVTLNAQLIISKSVTITTDGKANRTIYCGADASSDSVIVVNENNKIVTFKGVSEESQLVFDGNSNTVTLSKYFIYPGTKNIHAKKVVMQYVTMQNVKSSSKYGSAICSYSPIEAQNCTFVECESTGTDAAGGAIYLGSTSAGTKFTNCQFKKCTTSGRGGAIYSEKGIDIISCTFGDEKDIANGGNIATKAGGAICIGNENVLNIESSKFYGNRSNAQFGGAVAMRSEKSTVSLSGNVVFESNTADGGGYGGGAIMTGKALIVADNANVTIKNNTTGDVGGGIYFNAGATPTFTLGDGAVLAMSGNADKNGLVNIAVKTGMLQVGVQFIVGNNVADRITNVNVGDITYGIDAEGRIIAINE